MKETLTVLLMFCVFLLHGQDNIFDAARKGDTTRLKEILQDFPELINSTDERGNTPLILASYRGNYSAVCLLIKEGVDVNKGFGQGTALHGVSYKGHYKIAKILLENGCKPDEQDVNGTTPILYATILGHIEIAKLLYQYGANIDHKDNTGQSARMYAKSLNRSELLKLFNKKK